MTAASIDDWMGIGGFALGVLGFIATLAMGIWAVKDGRRQRNEREKAVITAHAVIERTYGLLIGIKPSVAPLGAMYVKAMDDGLAAINAQRSDLARL